MEQEFQLHREYTEIRKERHLLRSYEITQQSENLLLDNQYFDDNDVLIIA